MRAFATLFVLAALAAGQDPAKTEEKPTEVAPLPKGETKVLEAVVMKVEGVAQARAEPKAKWVQLKVNDALKPGAVVRTGRESSVALRVGMNASMLIERQSRVAIPEIIQDGDVLRTRVKLTFGKTDVRVDRIGLKNDFGVATPTATMAVRGTTMGIGFNASSGSTFKGVPSNKLRAIEVAWLEGFTTYLSGDDAGSESNPLPAVHAFMERYVTPLQGAISTEEKVDPGQDPGSEGNPASETGLTTGQQNQGTGKTNPGGNSRDTAQQGKDGK